MSWTSATVICDSADRPAWLKARARGITATDVARLMTPSGRAIVIAEKLYGTADSDTSYMAHGREREPIIAEGVKAKFGMEHNTFLYAGTNLQHLATGSGRDQNVNEAAANNPSCVRRPDAVAGVGARCGACPSRVGAAPQRHSCRS